MVLCGVCMILFFFFFKQKTAYEMRISDWSSDVCSSDLRADRIVDPVDLPHAQGAGIGCEKGKVRMERRTFLAGTAVGSFAVALNWPAPTLAEGGDRLLDGFKTPPRSEEHTSELQSLMRISYAVFCLQKKIKYTTPD